MFNHPSLEKRKLKLRPLTVSEIMSETVQTYAAIFVRLALPLFGLGVPLLLVVNVLQGRLLDALYSANIDFNNPRVAQNLSPAQAQALLSALIGPLVGVLFISMVTTLVEAVLIGSLASYMTSERKFGLAPSLAGVRAVLGARLLPLTGALLIYALIVIGLTIALAFVLFLCGLGLGILAYVAITAQALLTPVMVLERVGVVEGMRRAWYLAKRRFWAIVAVVVVLSIASGVLNLFVNLIPSNGLAMVTSWLVTLLLVPLTPIAMTLIYYDVRTRYEDLEGALNASPVADARPADITSPRPVAPLMEGADFTNLAVLTVGVFVLLLAIGALQLATGGGLRTL